jgi:hypothetical protein
MLSKKYLAYSGDKFDIEWYFDESGYSPNL